MAATLADFALLLVDDHPLFRDGLTLAIAARAPTVDVVAVATTAEAELHLAEAPERFDLVIVDYRLPGGADGLDWARRARAHHPTMACALMSGDTQAGLADAARSAGLAAFLPKSLDVDALLEALRAIARGDRWFPPSDDAGMTTSALTSRQQEIVGLAAGGASSKEIARRLGISPTTVRNHFCQIFERLGARNRAQAVALAARASATDGTPADASIPNITTRHSR